MKSTTTTTFDVSAVVAAVSSPSLFSPSPTPAFFPARKLSHLTFPSVPVIDTSFDLITIALILCFFFLSLLSLSFILHLRIKSRHFLKLQNFSLHWTPRFLLVVMLFLWSINELFRLPIFRKSFIFPFLPSLSLSHQTQFCKFHLILSFGLYEPGFLVVLLFLVNISTKKRSPGNLWAIGFVAITCLPLVVALYLAVYVLPGRLYLPPVFYRSSVLLKDENYGSHIVYCTYPLLAIVIFGAFGVVYILVFLANCWKIVAIVINKRLKSRVNVLVGTVVVCLGAQILMLTITAFWVPDDVLYYVFVLVNFASFLTCGAVAEGILVIMPTTDSLKEASDIREEGIDDLDECV
ncbi:uncharacterized protein LOC109133696 [Beta vulgaris subsp. vulgaris]|uniref:uncharacterized protein LOC109133696 n=1 Tax=Beta vulgaris subsp. vulgaris TaxID=3555 RepID=UPI002036BB17|nr:uncharacterized protein LOC109133696 [Beta vulgaris subsp. vulgaris]